MAIFTVSSRANLYLPNTMIDLEMRLETSEERSARTEGFTDSLYFVY